MTSATTTDRVLTPLEEGWLAGLLEGKGTFGTKPNVVVHMTDRDIVERFMALTGAPTLYPTKQQQPHRKPTWRATVSGEAAVISWPTSAADGGPEAVADRPSHRCMGSEAAPEDHRRRRGTTAPQRWRAGRRHRCVDGVPAGVPVPGSPTRQVVQLPSVSPSQAASASASLTADVAHVRPLLGEELVALRPGRFTHLSKLVPDVLVDGDADPLAGGGGGLLDRDVTGRLEREAPFLRSLRPGR